MTKITVKPYRNFKDYEQTYFMVTIVKDGIMDFNESVKTLEEVKSIANHFNVQLPETF